MSGVGEGGGSTRASSRPEPGAEGGAAPEFLAIVGPTAAGKTRLSLEVAGLLDGEIISMDSRQVYRGMDVGTAKATLGERAAVPHHGLDILDPDVSYSAGEFARDARQWICEIRGRGRVPLLVGGTGFYLKAVMEPLFEEPPMDEARLERLREYLAGLERESLEAWLEALDPGRAEVAVEGGRQRMTRTLEVALLTGRPLSEWHQDAEGADGSLGGGAPMEGGWTREGIPGLVVILTLEREELDRRIRERCERMVEDGLVEEVDRLLRAGYVVDDPGLTGAGYREMAENLSGSMELDEAVDRMEVRTRQYSRRQLTWFRNQVPEDAVRVDAEAPLADQVEQVLDAWRRRGGGMRGDDDGRGREAGTGGEAAVRGDGRLEAADNGVGNREQGTRTKEGAGTT